MKWLVKYVGPLFFLIPQGKGHISLYSNRHDET